MMIKNTKQNVCFFLFIFFSFLTIVIFISKYQGHSESIKNTCNWFLENAIFQTNSNSVGALKGKFDLNIGKEEMYKMRIQDLKDNNVIYDHYEDSILYFAESDEWDYKSMIIEAETGNILVGRKVPKKPGIKDYFMYESHQLRFGKVDLNAIAERYREILAEKDIHINTPIYLSVRSDIEDISYKNFEDIKSIKFNHVTPIFYTGHMNEVLYQAYINIPLMVIYKSIAQSWLRLFYGILATLLVLSIYFYIDDFRERRKKGIFCIKRGKYYKIGHLLFSFDELKLTYKKESYKLTPRIADLLLFILEEEDHCISNETLKNMFISQSNITSFISLTRRTLTQANCIYELRYEKKNKLYRLQLKTKVDKEPIDDNPDLTPYEQEFDTN